MPAVSEICRRLDGLPLAIELAAARAALFTPHEPEAEWATAWAAGRALTAAQAVAEALEDVDTTSRSGERLLLVGSGLI